MAITINSIHRIPVAVHEHIVLHQVCAIPGHDVGGIGVYEALEAWVVSIKNLRGALCLVFSIYTITHTIRERILHLAIDR